MRTQSSLALACTLAALLTACGGGGSGSGGSLPITTPSSTPQPVQPTNVSFVIKIPAIGSASAIVAKSGAHRMDFSAATKSVTIALGTQVLKTADVSATSTLCKSASGGGRTCTVGVNAPSGNNQFTIKAYDQANGTGNAISQGTVQTTVSTQPITVNVAVTGTIVKLAVALSNPYPPAGTATAVNVFVTGYDVDGNVVMGPYPSPVSLQNSDTSGATTLSATTVANSSTAVSLQYSGVTPYGSATITATLAGMAPVSTTFAPTPAFLNTYQPPQVSGRFGPMGPSPWNITKGPDGNMWASAIGFSELIKIAPNGSMTPYPLPSSSDRLSGIVAGADGNLWFAEEQNNSIGKMTTSGVVTEYPLPQSAGYASPECVGLGKDGNVWFFDSANDVVGSITPSGTIAEYPLPSSNAYINAIATGPDGNLWMTDIGDNAILKVSTSGQVLASYSLPSASTEPYGITPGPDGNVWFAEFGKSRIGRITTSGTLSEFAIPTGGANPIAITAGPDGKMWFAEDGPFVGIGKIGYITVDGKQVRDFFGDGLNVHDLAFDANGTLWYVALQPVPFGNQEIGTFGL